MGGNVGGGGALNIDLPMIQSKTLSPSSSPSLPSSSSSSSSSSDSSSPKFPVPVNKSVSFGQSCNAACSRCSISSGSRIDFVHGKESNRSGGSLFDVILRQVPSSFEVESAIAALRGFVEGIPSLGLEFDWLLQILYSSISVLKAFRLLQTEPFVKRLVISLATDKAVWNAILNNEMVRKLRESCNTAGILRLPNYDEEPDMTTSTLNRVLGIIRDKIAGIIQQFQLLMDQFSRSLGGDNPTKETRAKETRDEVEDKVRSSFLLSIVILVIVVVTRAHKAC